MFCIEVKRGTDWELVPGKYKKERDAEKALTSKKAEAVHHRTARAGAPLPEFRVVPYTPKGV